MLIQTVRELQIHKYVITVAFFGVLTATGCSTVEQLKQGLPEVTKLGPNEYEIFYLGGIFHDRKTLWQKWDAEATKVCNGKYEVIERKYENNIEGSDNVNGRIRCSRGSPTVSIGAPPASSERKDVTSAPAPVRPQLPPQTMGVAQMQQRLSELGYQPGPADGKMGKNSVDALKKFQHDSNLAETGKIDNETVAKLQQMKEAKAELSHSQKPPISETSQNEPSKLPDRTSTVKIDEEAKPTIPAPAKARSALDL